jgi:RNA polymerase sigma-70 factor, ECF subfamily
VDQPSEEEIVRWYPRLFRTALRLTGSTEDAADLTQQAFCQAIDKWKAFDGASQPTTWLHQILVNCVRDWARRRAVRATEPVDQWDVVPLVHNAPSQHDDLERREQLGSLRQAVETLTPPLRQALVITVLDGYSYQEAAEMLNVPPGTIASRVHQAREQLRKFLNPTTGEA